jgi:anti-repressor protein
MSQAQISLRVPIPSSNPFLQSALQTFDSPTFGAVRVIEREGLPWFVAKDVCEALELDNVGQSLSSLDDDEKNTIIINDGIPGNPNRAIISEPGLYSLILRSRKPEAKAFKRWITHEVIPAIRRTGGYMAAGQNDTPESIMARAVLIAQDTITRLQERAVALETQAEVDRPKVVFADSIEVSKSTILVGELAKLIKQSTQYDIGQKRMFDWLRDNGFLHKRGSDRNMPTQKSMDMGLIVIKEGSRIGSSGESHITKTPKVTGKGQIYFVNRFREILDGQQGVRQ